MNHKPRGPKGPAKHLAPPSSSSASGHVEGGGHQLAINTPLAAYRFGHGSRDIWRRIQLLCESPCGAHQDGLREFVSRLIIDHKDHICKIRTDISAELVCVLDELAELAEGLGQSLMSEYDDEILERYARRPPGEELWGRLTKLGDRALAGDDELHRLYGFGAELGSLSLKLLERPPRTIFKRAEMDLYYRWLDEGVPESLPDIGPLSLRACDLPERVRWQVPPIRTLAQLVPGPDALGRREAMEKFLVVHPELCPVFDVARGIDGSDLSRMAFNLDDLTREGLGRLMPSPVQPASASGLEQRDLGLVHSPTKPGQTTKPFWDKHNWQVMYDGNVDRVVRFDACKIVLILDVFQEEKWPDWIDSPASVPDSILYEWVKSTREQFNNLSRRVKLKSRQNGKKIGWHISDSE